MDFSRWSSPASLRAAALTLAFISLGTLGCPEQENLPAAPDLVAPPTPSDFVITLMSGTQYNFAWAVSDPTNVDRYRVYLLGGGFVPDELLFETTLTSDQHDAGISLRGLQFAVTAVSPDGIEGDGPVATAP
jgi:hypothetical protein